MILDTDFLIPLLRKDPTVVALLQALAEEGQSIFITHVNLWELYQGAFKSKKVEENLREVEDLIQNYEILSFSQASDKRFGELIGKLEKEGTPIGVLDTLIASIALEHNTYVVTRNVEHFAKTGVQIKTW